MLVVSQFTWSAFKPKKSILTFSTLLISLLSFGLSAEPLLFKAQKGSQILYLFGTVHVGSRSQQAINQPVEMAIKQSDALILEAELGGNIDFPSLVEHPVRDVLTNDELAQLNEIALESQLNIDMLKSLPSWQAALVLQQHVFTALDLHAEFGVEHQLNTWAQRHALPVKGLESLQFQIDLLADQPQGGKQMLLQTIQEWPYTENNIQCLIKSWSSGDVANLETMLKIDSDNDDFYQRFLIDRNRKWVQSLLTSSEYQSGTFFIAVGALHLVGQESLVVLLKQQGYSIEQLSHSKSAHCGMKTHV
ncbi:TraB/GumN family protein [Vibrio maritimus]